MVKSPWIEYPDYPPGDTFWRQSGEAWFTDVWKPYFQSLTHQEKKHYLQQWNLPSSWRDFYFDEKYQEFLFSTDDTI